MAPTTRTTLASFHGNKTFAPLRYRRTHAETTSILVLDTPPSSGQSLTVVTTLYALHRRRSFSKVPRFPTLWSTLAQFTLWDGRSHCLATPAMATTGRGGHANRARTTTGVLAINNNKGNVRSSFLLKGSFGSKFYWLEMSVLSCSTSLKAITVVLLDTVHVAAVGRQ